MAELIELWQDDDFRAVVKPIGMDVEKEFGGSGWLIHRLDTPVSGVLLLARTRRAAEAGRQLFAGRGVEKVYWAITANSLPFDQGTLTHWLEHSQKGNKSRVHPVAGAGRQEATLSYRRLAVGDRYLLYEVVLGTGRTHQIRAQLAAAGAPVRGDLKYGFARSNPGGGISLLARSLTFNHPFTEKIVALVADPPAADRLWAALVELCSGP